MLKRMFALAVATVAFGSLAFVDANQSAAFAGQPSRQIGSEACEHQLSFEAFQEACANPSINGWQIRPPQINVTCDKRELVWVPSRTTMEMRLPTLVDIEVSFGGKQTCVDDRVSYQSESVEKAICYQFEAVERIYSRTIYATCDDLAKFSSAIELCDATMKGALSGWSLVATERTNLVIDSCSGEVSSSIAVDKPGAETWGSQQVQATGQAPDLPFDMQVGPIMSQVPSELPGQLPGQVPGQLPGQVTGQLPGQVTGQLPGQVTGLPKGPVTGLPTGQAPVLPKGLPAGQPTGQGFK